jgi:hypothetical protein
MSLKQGQEVRDAADPDRVGIVVGTGSSLGARVLWCWNESLTWTLERPVTLAPRAAEDVLNNPEPGDRVEWRDGEVWTVEKVEHAIVAVHYRTTHPDGEVEEGDDRMAFRVWADPMDGGTGSPFVCVPRSDAPPPTI